tara:strand:- start:2739 stop:3017 length:279 start_codon:yes stop_codon:yes gene_type:complete
MTNRNNSRWHKEKWVKVLSYLNNESQFICNYIDRNKYSCRPLKRIDEKTQITLPELLKLYDINKIKDISLKKENDLGGKIIWKQCKFIKSKN